MAQQGRALEEVRAQTGAELSAREAALREREAAAAAAAARAEEDARQRALQDEQARPPVCPTHAANCRRLPKEAAEGGSRGKQARRDTFGHQPTEIALL